MVRVISSAGSVCHIGDDMAIPVGWKIASEKDPAPVVGKKK